jgi:hypothetical protein
MAPARPWSVEQHVRADAERVFVPVEQLVGAAPGDAVEIHSPESVSAHTGQIIEQVSDEARGAFFIVQLESG